MQSTVKICCVQLYSFDSLLIRWRKFTPIDEAFSRNVVGNITGTPIDRDTASQYDPRHIQRINKESKEYNCTQQIFTVDCIKLNDLLEKYNLFHVDYLSIDTEGGEEKILEAIDYDTFDITVIGVENNYDTPFARNFLSKKGYTYIGKVGADEFFLKQ